MTRTLFALTALTAAWFAGPAAAAKPTFAAGVKSVTGRIEPAEAKPGQTVQFLVTVELNQYYYTYPTVQPERSHASSRTDIELPTSNDLLFVEPVSDPAGPKTKEADGKPLAYYPDRVTWAIPAVVPPAAAPGDRKVSLKAFKIVVCYDDGVDASCLQKRTVPVEASFNVLAGPPAEIDPKYKDAVAKLIGPMRGPPDIKAPDIKPAKTEDPDAPKAVSLKIKPDRNYAEDMAAVAAQLPAPTFDNVGFFVFLLTAAGWASSRC